MEDTQPHSASLPWIITVALIPASILLTTTPTLISHNIFLKCKTLLKSPMTFNLTLGKSQSSYTAQGPTLPTHLPLVVLLLLSSLLTGLLDASRTCLRAIAHAVPSVWNALPTYSIQLHTSGLHSHLLWVLAPTSHGWRGFL